MMIKKQIAFSRMNSVREHEEQSILEPLGDKKHCSTARQSTVVPKNMDTCAVKLLHVLTTNITVVSSTEPQRVEMEEEKLT
jgi:hypothetical protein